MTPQASLVDVELGESAVVSRQHAKIYYNFELKRWELAVEVRSSFRHTSFIGESGAVAVNICNRMSRMFHIHSSSKLHSQPQRVFNVIYIYKANGQHLVEVCMMPRKWNHRQWQGATGVMINMQQWDLSGSGQLARPGFGRVHVDAAEPGSSCFTGIWEAVQAAFPFGMDDVPPDSSSLSGDGVKLTSCGCPMCIA